MHRWSLSLSTFTDIIISDTATIQPQKQNITFGTVNKTDDQNA